MINSNNNDSLDFSGGKFITSATGILRIIVIILLLTSAIIFLRSDPCLDAPPWYDWLYPAISLLDAVVVTLSYATFVCGFITKEVLTNIIFDMVMSFLAAGTLIVVSVISMLNCSSLTGLSKFPTIIGIAAGVVLVISTAILFISLVSSKELQSRIIVEHHLANIPDPNGINRKSVVV